MARHRWATSAPSRGGFSFPQDREGRQGDPVAFDDREPDRDDVHPSDDESQPGGEGVREQPGRGRQWAVGRGAALVALGVALSLAVGLFLLRGGAPSEVASIALDHPTTGQQEGEATAELSGPTASGTSTAAERVGSIDTTASPDAAGSDPQRLIVHVAGAVSRPGIVELDAGSRVFEALEQAGGALPDADLAAINLASPVQDGLQIRVPLQGETLPPVAADAPLPGPGSPGSPDPSASGPPGQPGLININTADTAELETLPRIGPVLAERIIEWRTEHGGFSSPEDLDAVPGIGQAMLAALVPLVTV
ncbi:MULTISPECIES: ComEA family DNA-binding protein [unclassified Arthrobacter]|uniref:ComEA family DNA-binding protein n=1 Tax=unclassified Arthrobacter TaxID=235627 RepID=UPI001491E628|nr:MULTISPECIES: ComEA family DNA-binding protein [unclassified Arthrobacter]MBE0009793.1 ComEA family DNA-binding protein [Arthrobacter sp. AET 35A]NOJ63707.1 ComEA family DNA-binding protein [Arthrobacter sp. 147(2020)]